MDAAILHRERAVSSVLGINVLKWFYEMEQPASLSTQDSGPPLVSDEVWNLPFTVCQREQAVSATGFAYSTDPFDVLAESMYFTPAVAPPGYSNTVIYTQPCKQLCC